MKSKEAYTVSIGVLAVVDTYLTATVLPVPSARLVSVSRGS